MLVLLPIGHDETTIQRVPWVTLWLLVLCTAIHTAMWPRQFDSMGASYESYLAVEARFSEAPYLELEPEVARMLFQMNGVELDRAILQEMARFRAPPGDPAELAAAQAEFDAMQSALLEAREAHPGARFGLQLPDWRPYQWVSHIFMHGDWEHLIGNMLLLLLVGYCLEDRWGRPFFSALYLLGGLAAAGLFAFRHLGTPTGLVGASGAIAALMGAFLVRFGTGRVQFFYWIFYVFRGTFRLPAWLVLGLWIGFELHLAYGLEGAPGGGDGVAHWAHVGGFAFGAVVALGVRATGAERRWLAPSIDAKLATYQNPLLQRAMEQVRSGRPADAFELLERELPGTRENRDAARAYWDLALDLDRAREAAELAYATVQRDVRAGRFADAVELLHEIHGRAPGTRMDSSTLVRLALGLGSEGSSDDVALAVELALGAQPEAAPLPSATRLARALESAHPSLATRVAASGLLARELTEAARADLERIAELRVESVQREALRLREDALTLPDGDDSDDWLQTGSAFDDDPAHKRRE